MLPLPSVSDLPFRIMNGMCCATCFAKKSSFLSSKMLVHGLALLFSAIMFGQRFNHLLVINGSLRNCQTWRTGLCCNLDFISSACTVAYLYTYQHMFSPIEIVVLVFHFIVHAAYIIGGLTKGRCLVQHTVDNIEGFTGLCRLDM